MTLHLSSRSAVEVHPDALEVSPEEFEALRRVLEEVAPTPNRHRPSTNILRKQCAFVLPSVTGEYRFGQVQECRRLELEEMPVVVRRALEAARARHADYPLTDYALVQANLYAHGGVGLSPHADDEPFLTAGAPIYSFSLGATRPFSVYTTDDDKVLDVPLAHGDLLVMTGAMQTEFKHGIEKDRPAKYDPRINLTVRSVRAI